MLIGGIGGAVGLSFLARSHSRHRALGRGTYLRAPNSATVVTSVATVPSDDDSPVSPELMLVDPAPAVRAVPAVRVPKRSAPRRLLVGAVAALALSATAGSGVFVGLLSSSHREAALSDAVATPPPPIPPTPTHADVPKAANPSAPTTPTIPPKVAAAAVPKTANPAVPATPTSSRTRTAAVAPQAGVNGAPSGRSLAWAPVANASAYAVEISRNGESVYSATTSVPHVRVPNRWRRDGRTMTLSPGTYRWYVWPIFRRGATTPKFPSAVVVSKFEIAS